MRFKLKYLEQITGLFVLSAIALLTIVLVLMGINKRWYIEDPIYETIFNSAEGINRGTNIRYKGFVVGRVENRELLANNTVGVKFSIFQEYAHLVRENSIMELATNPFNIGGGLLLRPGKYISTQLESGSYIPSLDLPEGRRLVQQGLVEGRSADEISLLMGGAGDLMENLTVSLEIVNSELIPQFSSLLSLIHDVGSGKDQGPLGQTLSNVSAISTDAALIMRQIQLHSNELLHNLDALATEFNDPGKLARSLFAPDSSIAFVLDDQMALYNQVDSILQGINQSIEQVHLLTSYLNQSTPRITGLIEETRGTLDQSRDVLEGLKNNPLLRGGIPESRPQSGHYHGYRDMNF